MNIHPGIRIDKISAEGGGGLIFALGAMAIFLIGVPATRMFFAITLCGGMLLATALYYWRNQTRW